MEDYVGEDYEELPNLEESNESLDEQSDYEIENLNEEITKKKRLKKTIKNYVIIVTKMARKPRAPVFLSIATLAILLNACGSNVNSTLSIENNF